MTKQPLAVAISIDVEEEGLFCGKYSCRPAATHNTAWLDNFAPILKRQIRPTLFCAYSALIDPEARKILRGMSDLVEIGAHLHHWNTPPLAQNIPASGMLEAVPARQVAPELMESKLKAVLALCEETANKPVTSFRMGRWDLHKFMWPILQKRGILVDASVRPLHSFGNKDRGPDHFAAPCDPYWITGGKLLEVPLTVAPILPFMASLPGKKAWARNLRASVRHWGALALLPVQQPLWLMRLVTNLHASRGGRVLSLTWHSSEMSPGGAPHMPDKMAITRFITKVRRYLDWLESSFAITYVAMSDLAGDAFNFPPGPAAGFGDWQADSPHAA